MEIKILGTGCPNCRMLEKNIEMALEKSRAEAKIIKVTDIPIIMSYGIMSTPGLVINNNVVSYGKVNSVDEIIKLIEENKE